MNLHTGNKTTKQVGGDIIRFSQPAQHDCEAANQAGENEHVLPHQDARGKLMPTAI